MKRAFRVVPMPIWILLIILGLAAILMTLSQSNAEARPSAGSPSPSGLRIFAKLAQDAGYDVVSTREPNPEFRANDVPIVIELEFPDSSFWATYQAEKRMKTLRKHLDKHVEAGGTLLFSRLRYDFRQASLDVAESATKVEHGATVVGTVTAAANLEYPSYEAEGKSAEIWVREGDVLLQVVRVKDGRVVVLDDAIIATNRFITEHDNAALLMGLLRGFVPAGSRLVFMEAAWGNLREPTLMEQVGPWAAAAWSQLVLMVVVIAYTLGRRFGLPNLQRPRQAGQRDLVEATASFFRRARATDIALEAELADARHKILNELKLPRGTEWEVWSERVPERLRQVYREVEVASQARVATADAMRLARELDSEVTLYVGEKRLASRRRLRKSGTSGRGF